MPKLRLIEFNNLIYVVIGLGYEAKFNPPEVYYAVPLKGNLIRTAICALNPEKIPLALASEITDKNKINIILTLFS